MPLNAAFLRAFDRQTWAEPAPPRSSGFSGAQICAALLISALASMALLARAGLMVDPWAGSTIPYWLAATVAAGLRFGVGRGSSKAAQALGDLAEYVAIFTALALMGAVTSYPLAALTHGYADPVLQRIDTALHFDWVAWYRAVADHRALQWLGTAAYENIYFTPAVLFGWYAWHGDRREAHRFLASFWLAAIITLSLFSLMPAVGPFSYLWHGPIPYMPVSELWQPDLIPALRAHQVHVVDLGQLRGIVSAPSFHAAAGTLYIATAWRVRPLRVPLLIASVAMLLATPVEGTHYLSDIVLGSIVAFIAMAVVDVTMRLHTRQSPAVA